MTPRPIHGDADLLRRALALGWRIVHYPDTGRRIVPPHAIAPHHHGAEVALITAAVQMRLPALLALLNADAPSPSHPTPATSGAT